jgi:hypothetical protein
LSLFSFAERYAEDFDKQVVDIAGPFPPPRLLAFFTLAFPKQCLLNPYLFWDGKQSMTEKNALCRLTPPPEAHSHIENVKPINGKGKAAEARSSAKRLIVLGKLNKNLEADYFHHFITFYEFIYLCKYFMNFLCLHFRGIFFALACPLRASRARDGMPGNFYGRVKIVSRLKGAARLVVGIFGWKKTARRTCLFPESSFRLTRHGLRQ